MGKILEHKHIIIRAEILNPPVEKDLEFMNEWFKELIEDIGMTILLGPYTVYSNKVGNRGFTGIVAIDTSSATLHIWDECSPGILQFDLYTCSCLDVKVVLQKLSYFKPSKVEYKIIDRENGLDILESKIETLL